MAYAELQVTTNYSFLRGASHPEELFAQAAAYGPLRPRHRRPQLRRRYRPRLGSRQDHPDPPSRRLPPDPPRTATILLAYPTDRPAWSPPLPPSSPKARRRTGKGGCDLDWTDLQEGGDGLLYILIPDQPDDRLRTQLDRLATDAPGRAYLAATIRRRPGDATRIHRLAQLAITYRIPLIATGDVLFHHPDRRILQDVVTCIREGCTIDNAGFKARALRRPSPQAARRNGPPFRPLSRRHRPHRRTRRPLPLRPVRPEVPIPRRNRRSPAYPPKQTLERLTWEGAAHRYAGIIPEKVVTQLQHELRLIDGLGYAPYFLTVKQHRPLRPQRRHPLPGPRIRRQLRGLLRSGNHQHRPH